MTDVEQALVALGRDVEFPPTPEVAARVRARLGPARRRRAPAWRAAALAVGALAVALGAAMAVPPARSAILRFLHLGGVTIVRVESLPAAEERSLTEPLGQRMRVARIQRNVGFDPLVPHGIRHAYVFREFVSLLFRVRGKTVLLNEFPGDGGFLKKATVLGTRVEPVDVGGAGGYWIAGARHVLEVPTRPPRFAGNVLIWQRNDVTLRLEGPLSKSDALAVARDLE